MNRRTFLSTLTRAQTASIQLILDPVQAKYPGNERVKPCGKGNHDGVCYDPSRKHLTYHGYEHKESCEKREQVACDDDRGMWIPIGKPVLVEETR